MAVLETPSGNPILASLLSFVIPGLGQVYSKRVFVGAIWFFSAVVLWFGGLGWILHILSAIFAYRYTSRRF